jgi:hypothetical protein
MASDKIKDLAYEKYYVITFRYNLENYVLCKPDVKYTFVPLEPTKAEDLPKLNISKFADTDSAQEALVSLPTFYVAGEEIYPEIKQNVYMWDLL